MRPWDTEELEPPAVAFNVTIAPSSGCPSKHQVRTSRWGCKEKEETKLKQSNFIACVGITKGSCYTDSSRVKKEKLISWNVAFKRVCRKRRMGFCHIVSNKYDFQKPTFLLHLSSGGKWGPFWYWWLILFLWSTQAEQRLLVVSLGVFLRKQSGLEGLHDRPSLIVTQ